MQFEEDFPIQTQSDKYNWKDADDLAQSSPPWLYPKIDCRVIAGTVNLNGTLRVQVLRLLHENSLSKITRLVRQAQNARVPLQDFADRFSATVLPLALATASVAFLVWALVGVFVKKTTKLEAALDGLMKAIAVLVVSCPCAIGLAVSVTKLDIYKAFSNNTRSQW